MEYELDHVFVCASFGAPEADRLAALGLTEGPPNRHPGQGTANRRFFFANAMLEFLWVENAEEAQGPVARPLRLWERWSRRDSGACPFGVCLRPAHQGVREPPFPAWEFRPPYFPTPLFLYVGMNAESVEEPLLLYFPFVRRPEAIPAQERPPVDHAAGLRELTALRIFGPRASTAARAAEQAGAVSYLEGTEHLMEIGFDGERQGGRADLRPASPLVICW
jgi:hypothetical protein